LPAVASWILRIPGIIADVEQLSTPVVDRAMFERLFGVRRRRAIELMRHFGGFRSGNTVLVERQSLLSGLRQFECGPDYTREHARKQKVADELDALHRGSAGAVIRLPVSADVRQRTPYDLPSGISLQPGQLIVAFTAPEELFGKLYELAMAAVNDFDGITQAITLQPGRR
jgi:hypothetical protein